ncbi:Molybdenum cofactor sulfurase [Camellia lanceoleosa]|nr:Molybdenum cofactor sulfurase [Camellia lanceoleosa]
MNKLDSDKQQFMKEFSGDYGYSNASKNIDQIRATEFKRLDGLVYLDHAGATLYSELQMEAIFKGLTTNVYGNPHSQSDSSLATSDIVREARQQVLHFCNASPKDYKCIFTSGATAALKLVGEAFPWSSHSAFMYTMENHNSVLGIREYALNKGATAFAIDIEEAAHVGVGFRSPVSSIKVLRHHIQRRNEARILEEELTGNAFNLFAFPSECNFSGSRFSLDLVKIIKDDSERVLEGSPYCKGRWMVLLDAAKGCATEPPDLSKYQADFVIISFYKLFGYPTGLGALIVKTEAAKLLKKTYFSGGTVAASIADIDFVKRREGVEEFFEDGTISFLSIASIHQGFKILNSLSMSAISRHTASLARYVRNILLALRHENGDRVCTLYGNHKSKVLYDEQGPIVSFNLKRPDHSWFGYREVEKLASLSGIQLRAGCFCNPGACAKYLGLSHLDLLSNIEAGHICWDDHDIVNGKPTGAVRISLGYMSTFEDAKKFINFIVNSFASVPIQSEYVYQSSARSICFPREGIKREIARYYLRSITVYPIKSCAGFRVDNWPISNTGLLHDREWLLKSLSGEILTQKKVPEMCFINTFIDLNLGILFVESPRCKVKLQIILETDLSTSGRDELGLYAQRYKVRGYDNEVDTWFSNAVGRPCTLLRCLGSKNSLCLNKAKKEGMCRDLETKLNFVNEAQFLLISEESVSDLNNRLSSNVQEGFQGPPIQINPMRFRPNLVISGGAPYAEDEWRSLKIGNKYFVSLGGCNRCQMINLNPQEGEVQRSWEPLATLASYRRVKGKILFGILLRYDNNNLVLDTDSWLQVGQEVHPNTN